VTVPPLPATDGAAHVRLTALRRTFGGRTALDGFDLEVRPGELLTLLGPSGCGKTTALRILAGLEQCDSGTVQVDGRDLSAVPPDRRDMAMVFQAYSLFPNLDARDNVAFGLRVRGVATAARRRRAEALLELVGLGSHARRYPQQMSGGQQQRVALARALAVEPRILLLDEPLSELDAVVRVQLREEIHTLQRSLGITTLLVTHDQEEALSISDRVAVMNAGRLEQCATPTEIYTRPSCLFVASFVGTMNHLPGTLAHGGRSVEVYGHHLPVVAPSQVPVGAGPVTALVRPETMRLVPDAQGTARIEHVSFRGAATRVTARLGDGRAVQVDLPSSQGVGLQPGVSARLDVEHHPVLVAPTTGTGPAPGHPGPR
jgi:putative spermidine/putrescine transport system ATP-binding protein